MHQKLCLSVISKVTVLFCRNGILQAEPSSSATTNIRTGRGALLLCDGCDGDRRHSGGFLLRIMPPSWHPVPACVRNVHPAGGLILSVATKIRIGCGPRCRYGRCRRNHSSLPQRRLESDAERCSCATVAAETGATPAALYLGLCRLRGIQSPPASATASCRRNHSSLPQRRLESDAECCCGGDWLHSGGFLLGIMPPS